MNSIERQLQLCLQRIKNWAGENGFSFQKLKLPASIFAPNANFTMIRDSKWGADKTTLVHLYRSLVRSKLDYGCIIYGSARTSYSKALDAVHHQGLWLCLGAFRTSPTDSLYV